jgi:hypothetical protein
LSALAEHGVARVSFGARPYFIAMKALEDAARARQLDVSMCAGKWAGGKWRLIARFLLSENRPVPLFTPLKLPSA